MDARHIETTAGSADEPAGGEAPFTASKSLVLILALVNFANILDFVIMMPLGPQLMRELSIGTHEFSLLVSAYTFSACVFSLLSSQFVDRFARKASFLTFFTGFLAGTALCAAAQTYEAMLVGRLVAGAFGGVLSSMMFTIIGERIPARDRGKATGFVMSAFAAASILGLPAGLYLARTFGRSVPFEAICAIGFAILVGSFVALPRMDEHLAAQRGKARPSPLEVFAPRNHRVGFLLTSIVVFGQFSIIPLLSSFLVMNAGMPEEKLPLVYLCGGIATILSSRFAGVLSDRYGATRVFVFACFVAVAPILVLTHLGISSVPWVLTVTTLFMVTISSRMIPMQSLITLRADQRTRGAYMSLLSAVQHAMSGVAAYAGGLFVTRTAAGTLSGFGEAGIVTACTSVAAAFVVQLYAKPAAAATAPHQAELGQGQF